jgi:hypothetical protein
MHYQPKGIRECRRGLQVVACKCVAVGYVMLNLITAAAFMGFVS